MLNAPIPKNEKERMEALRSLNILDTAPEERFDVLTKMASKMLAVPISVVSIVDKDREWYKSCEGLNIKQGARNISFCGHAMLSEDVFIIEDTYLDSRFKDNPTVIGAPFIRFYAGVRMRDLKTNLPIGVFCVKDYKPRKFDSTQIDYLLMLAQRAEIELNKK